MNKRDKKVVKSCMKFKAKPRRIKLQKLKRSNKVKISHKAHDNVYKLVFKEPEIFLDFLKDFIPIDILKSIRPEDITDVTERFLPLFSENKDSDTVKKIRLKGDEPLFVISILEHENKVVRP